jgi:hypothetical protein
VIKKEIMKIVAATLLGDGHLEKRAANQNARFSIKLKEQHKDHLEYINIYISEVTGTSFYYIAPTSYEIKGKLCNISGTYTLRSKVHPMYTKMHERYYLNRIKRVDEHYLTLIDAEFMAVWYQQDGYLHHPKDSINPTPECVLCTDNFTYGDQLLLRRAIIEKTGYIFNIQKRGLNKNGEQTYRLFLSRKQTHQFIEYIEKHVQSSFQYKIEC